jgi:hypothetical protein
VEETDLTKSFDGWLTPDASTAKLREIVLGWCRDLATDKNPRWLTLSGRSGCGKTFLARCVWSLWRRKWSYFRPGRPIGQNGWSYTMPAVWVDCAGLQSLSFDDRRRLLDEAGDSWLCVVDDLGAGANSSEWFVSEMLGFLNQRMGRWTFLSTNLTPRRKPLFNSDVAGLVATITSVEKTE